VDHDTIGGLIVVLLGGWGVKKALAAGRAEQEKLDEVWRTAATRVRGEVQIEKGGLFRPPARRIVLRSGDTRILVETVTDVQLGGGRSTSTCVTAGPIEGLGDVSMRVAPRSAIGLGRVSKLLRLAEVATKNEAFDAQMRVHGSPVALVREMLDARLSKRVVELGEGFVITDASVVVAREGQPQDAGTIVAMVSFAEEIAARWAEMVEAPRALADALDLERVVGEPGVIGRGIRRGTEVTLEVRVGREALMTVASFEALSGKRVEITREGLAMDRDDMVRAVDAALESARPAGAYR
jgi:hypothetical protein